MRFFLPLLLTVTALACTDSAPVPNLAPLPDAGLEEDTTEEENAITNHQCDRDEDCDDGLFCTGFERCEAGRCTPTQDPCQDDVACTQDTCQEQEQRCTFLPQDASCGPDQFCDAKFGCLDQIPAEPEADATDEMDLEDTTEEDLLDVLDLPDPPDELDVPDPEDMTEPTDLELDLPSPDLITDLEPQEDVDLITDPPEDLGEDEPDITEDEPPECLQDQDCDDGLFCNGPERCLDAQCVAGEAPLLDDGVPCTRDTCNEATNLILHRPISALCDNGLFCDGVETCDAQRGCQQGEAPSTDDGVSCTQDACDEDADLIVHVPVDSLCDNGLFCDGAETCDPTLDCQAGAAPNVDDGNDCTQDTCDEATDTFVHDPRDAFCADGLFCNGEEVCDAIQGCMPGIPVVLEDNIGCTTGRCDEAADVIVQEPNDASCDNGLFCDGVETCDPSRGCVAGTAPVVDDGVGCTEDRCDEVRDLIAHTPVDTLCASNDRCQNSVCDPALGCQDEPILACLPSDLCCAPGCHANNDNDCAPQCGNGELEAPEACDVGSICADGARCLDCQCVEACGDGRDNDGDGETDCEDIDCAGDGQCPMVIPFAALQTQQGGIAAWNTTAVSFEEPQLGHRLPRSINQCGSPYTYRFLGSPDEPGEGKGGPINPESPGAATAMGPAQGIWHLRAALQRHGYNLSDLHFGFGRMDLGQDIEGEDWWVEDSVETRRYQGGLLWFSLAGQRILEAPMPELLLHVDYHVPSICGDEEIRARSVPIAAQEWSHRAQPGSAFYEVAAAWLQDLVLASAVYISVDTLEPATQFDFSSQGRTGAYYEADTLYLESTPP